MMFLSSFCCKITSLRTGCFIIGAYTIVFSLLNFLFYLCSFAVPNFEILIHLNILPEQIGPYGRLWYAIGNVAFWIMYIQTSIQLVVGVLKDQRERLFLFFLWSKVGIIWGFCSLVFEVSFWNTNFQLVSVFATITLDIAIPFYFSLVVLSYIQKLKKEEKKENKDEVQSPGLTPKSE